MSEKHLVKLGYFIPIAIWGITQKRMLTLQEFLLICILGLLVDMYYREVK